MAGGSFSSEAWQNCFPFLSLLACLWGKWKCCFFHLAIKNQLGTGPSEHQKKKKTLHLTFSVQFKNKQTNKPSSVRHTN
jgi:hypothetical protein